MWYQEEKIFFPVCQI